jgi:hypothetical protein
MGARKCQDIYPNPDGILVNIGLEFLLHNIEFMHVFMFSHLPLYMESLC